MRYYLTLPDPEKARVGGEFGFYSHGAQGFAEELQDALRTGGVFQKWLATQDEPDDVDPALAATDPNAVVTGTQDDLHIDLQAVTILSGDVLKHRLRLLAGTYWQLRDVTAS